MLSLQHACERRQITLLDLRVAKLQALFKRRRHIELQVVGVPQRVPKASLGYSTHYISKASVKHVM
jgi:hypothetical protein